MKRKKKPHDEHISEGWLIPYADLLTLLLALFIVLFASSTVDVSKLKAMSQSFSSVFNGGSGMITNSAISPEKQEEKEDVSARTKAQSYEIAELEELKAKATAYIKKNKLEKDIKAEITEEGLVFTIRDRALFSPGQATVTGQSREIAAGMSRLLAEAGERQIQVSGHTDNIPIRTAKYPSNWELSTDRAISFMRTLLENKSLSPRQFTVSGYGEYRPLATNTTEAGRSQNRRVEVIVRPLVDIQAKNLIKAPAGN
ncbi:flagellar motor protein MotB [Exiguobacterium flavidum]|uniref:flagellar motor protein MotB n=1 Tax=Exiguobacterium flavidum TaxID=2184695 RepID=UPI000DF7747F|nr:flagellar motor protein MotB [Exiguobacterium flavidum]